MDVYCTRCKHLDKYVISHHENPRDYGTRLICRVKLKKWLAIYDKKINLKRLRNLRRKSCKWYNQKNLPDIIEQWNLWEKQ